MLSATCKPYMLSVVMLNVVMLSVVMLNVIMLSVVMLSIVSHFVPCNCFGYRNLCE